MKYIKNSKKQFLLADIYNCSLSHLNNFEDFIQVYFDRYSNNCDCSFFKKILRYEFKLNSVDKIKNLFHMLNKCEEEMSYRFLSIIDFDKIYGFSKYAVLNLCLQHIFNYAKFNKEFIKVVDDLVLKFTDMIFLELYDLLKITLINSDVEKQIFLQKKNIEMKHFLKLLFLILPQIYLTKIMTIKILNLLNNLFV